jgi:tetratricopeptide (TPR) repeat protein
MAGKKNRSLDENAKKRKERDIEKTEAWHAADWRYTGMLAQDMMPLLGSPLTGEERDDFLMEILSDCPEYYPALLELGQRSMQKGKDKTARDFIDRGLQSLRTHFTREDLLDAYYAICDLFEKYLRFETAIEYYNQLSKIATDKGGVHDSLASCYAYLGDLDKAIEEQQQALKLSPSNHRLNCNMGWLEMIRGNLHEAKDALERSLELDRTDEVTVNNYQICKQMLENKQLKDWETYLLRDVDYEKLEELIAADEGYEKEVQQYNHSRIEAFEVDLIRNPHYTPTKKYDLLFTLKYIMKFIWDLHDYTFFFYEDVITIRGEFVSIMHSFILKTSDIDEEILNDVYASLLEFYKFLTARKVIPGYEELENVMREAKPKLVKKMLRYNEIRHDENYSEDAKEKIREELFGDTYFLPFL